MSRDHLNDVKLLSVRDVASALGISARTVWRWAATDPHFPHPITIGERCVRWRLADLKRFIDRRAGTAADRTSAAESNETST